MPHASFSCDISTKDRQSGPQKSRRQIFPIISHSDKQKNEDKVNFEKEGVTLTAQEEKLMKDILCYGSSSITQRYQRLDMNYRVGNDIKNYLLKKGLISVVDVPLQKGRMKGLLLTEKGEKVLGISTGKSKRFGNPEHRYWAKRIAEHLRASGYSVEEEVPVGGGKTIDLVATRDGRRIAFEIETGKSDVAANVKKCLDAGMNKVVIITTDVKSMQAVRNSVSPGHGILILTGSEALKNSNW
jgi:predicted transcriptional regulator